MSWDNGQMAAPPRDGTRIVAMGHVTSQEPDGGVVVDPFLLEIYWASDMGDESGWRNGADNLALAWQLGDEVRIGWWTISPPGGWRGAPAAGLESWRWPDHGRDGTWDVEAEEGLAPQGLEAARISAVAGLLAEDAAEGLPLEDLLGRAFLAGVEAEADAVTPEFCRLQERVLAMEARLEAAGRLLEGARQFCGLGDTAEGCAAEADADNLALRH